MTYITEHWQVITVAIAAIISILNAVTKHWSTEKGLIRVIGFIVEVLSIFASKDVAIGGGPMKKFKLPLQSVKPPEEKVENETIFPDDDPTPKPDDS